MGISDIIDSLNEPGVSEWSGVMTSWRKQQPINKQEVIELLRSGVPVPSNAAEFLAEVLEGGYPFQRGNKPWYPVNDLFRQPYFVKKWVHELEEWIKDPSTMPDDTDSEVRKEFESYHIRAVSRHRKDKIKPNVLAVKLVAEMVELSERMVRKKITDFNKMVEQVAEKNGYTVKEVNDYLLQ
jgi:hypothetical protein